jgi:DNA end-binding protein Ku
MASTVWKDHLAPDQFKNQFRERLNQLISSRAAEHQITPVEAPRSGKVIDIMDALKRSLAEVKSIKQPEQVAPQTQRKPARAQEQVSDKQSRRRGSKKPA